MKKVTIKISGMHCASCSGLIEKSLQKKDSIADISVSLASNSATIKYNETMIGINELSKEIADLGYKVVAELNTNGDKKYRRKFILSFILSIPIGATMFVEIKDLFGPYRMLADAILLLLGSIVVIGIGRNFHVGFIKKLLKGQSNMDTLISIGTLVALAFSLFAFFQTYVANKTIDFYHFLEGAVFIITFISLGKFLELRSKGKASEAIQSLMHLQAKDALVLKDKKEILTPMDNIVVGDVVIVKAGDKIPVDGEIISGNSSIDESVLTGESIPVYKTIKDEVFSGTIVQNGSLQIKVTKAQTETMLSKIVQTVQDAQNSKPPIQHLVDKISAIFVPVILLIAIIAFLGHRWYGGNIQQSLLIMIATIVIACPCAMGLATPMAIMVATGTGAKYGILIKGGEVLERSKNIDAVVFDKTGTLTEGKPSVTDIISLDQHISKEKLKKLIYYLAKNSNHPLSTSIVEYIQGKGNLSNEDILTTYDGNNLKNFKEITGKGLVGDFGGETVLFGNEKLLSEYAISLSDDVQFQLSQLQEQGKTVNFIATNNKVIGMVALFDKPKQDTIRGIETLKSMGIKTIMISGDTNKTVKAVANNIKIDDYYAEVYPEQKATIVKTLQSDGKQIAFVGDGINDAPALAQSDLGIAIGQGTDVAIETAQMILTTGNPYKVVEAIKLARKTYRIIQQNLFRAFAYNMILVPIAAIGFLEPMFASLAMSMSSVSVVVNSLRLKRIT